ncbi:MAG: single-stranded-DNA-specific exonuclease RecJ [Candidatus Kerfeldbacteria bacterium]|nr:single-stranded-DNA-specific exonuclease RecJ [Candidatus Kerfeldbacteria bacterium]
MPKRWSIAPPVAEDVQRRFPELDGVTLQLLTNRERTTQELVDEFLYPDYGEDLHDPFLFRQMRTAVDRIAHALKVKESIQLFGDYDVDGVSALTVLFATFRALGRSDIPVYIPDRYGEGYGLNLGAVEEFGRAGIRLLITCDCGTSNAEEIRRARELGMDVIVVDHHKQPPNVPSALAILNPAFAEETYPFKKLCSGGVAFKLACALLKEVRYGEGMLDRPLPQGWEKWLLDVVALSTVADVMPLLGENRTLVKHGLTVLKKTRRPGIRALAAMAGADLNKITSGAIGFVYGPRLNAAGRIKHANAAFELLTTEDSARADVLAAELHHTNADRQAITGDHVAEALRAVPKNPLPNLLTAHSPTWITGVVGLVAGRLKETFNRPALAVGKEGEKLVGSGRSIPGFDITAALAECKEFLSHFGGHPMACGFTLRSADHLTPFFLAMQTIAERELSGKNLSPVLALDMELALSAVDWKLVETLARFEPFGVGNPEPTFLSAGLLPVAFSKVGENGKHVRLEVHDGKGTTRKAIAFGMGAKADNLKIGSPIDCAYHVSVNEWNGNRELQLKVVDLRPSEA